MERHSRDLLLIFFAALLWGVCYVSAKVASSLIHPLLFTALLSFICTGWAIIFGRPELRDIPRDLKRAPGTLLGLGFFGMLMGNLFLYYALARVGVGIGAVIAKLEPIFTVIFASLLLKERLTRAQYLFLGVAILGAVGVSSGSIESGELTPLPLLALIATAAAWGMSTVLGKAAINQGFSPDHASFYRFALGAVMIAPLLLFLHHDEFRKLLDLRALLLSIFTGGLGCYGFILFYRGIKTVPAGVAGAIELITPLTAGIIGVVLLGERWDGVQIGSAGILLYGVYRVSRG